MSKISLISLAVLVALCTVACEQKSQTVLPTVPTAPAVPGVPAISAVQMQRIESVYADAAKIAAEGVALIDKGKQIERDEGRQAANDTFLEAKNKLRKALEMTDEFTEAVEGDALTQAQIDTFLKRFSKEREQWLKVQKELGKVHD